MIAEKSLLRKQMHVLRNGCDNRSVLDAQITEHFLQSSLYCSCSTLLLYASYRSEADTFALLNRALADGKAVYLPRCEENTASMDFYRVLSVEDLVPGAFSILEPKVGSACLPKNLRDALCIVPGLAFTERGERLGYGRGYYDTFLEKTNTPTVGFCYGFQVVSSVPTEKHDKRMAYLCTEYGLVRCGA